MFMLPGKVDADLIMGKCKNSEVKVKIRLKSLKELMELGEVEFCAGGDLYIKGLQDGINSSLLEGLGEEVGVGEGDIEELPIWSYEVVRREDTDVFKDLRNRTHKDSSVWSRIVKDFSIEILCKEQDRLSNSVVITKDQARKFANQILEMCDD